MARLIGAKTFPVVDDSRGGRGAGIAHGLPVGTMCAGAFQSRCGLLRIPDSKSLRKLYVLGRPRTSGNREKTVG